MFLIHLHALAFDIFQFVFFVQIACNNGTNWSFLQIFNSNLGENLSRCTTQDKRALSLFWSLFALYVDHHKN